MSSIYALVLLTLAQSQADSASVFLYASKDACEKARTAQLSPTACVPAYMGPTEFDIFMRKMDKNYGH
ncbi:MAG TPA: hypothetical protein VMT66_12250 [Steroidobacteraceae bacterium]|nr:hypothetical protein [Steroidobacteraceae bacterium]